MGYETKYNLEIHSAGSEKERLCAKNAIEADEDLSCFFQTEYLCKWYGHEREMKAFSTIHPNIVFVLEGYGEESDDIWRKFFKNGKMQMENAQIIFGEFDEKKLK